MPWQLDHMHIAPEVSLCRALAPVVPFEAAAVALFSTRDSRAYLAGSHPTLKMLGDLQQTASEGPEYDLLLVNDVVLVDDLGTARSRWPRLAGILPAVEQMPGRLMLVPLGEAAPAPPLGFVAVSRDGPAFTVRDIELVSQLARLATLSLAARWTRQQSIGELFLDLEPDEISVAVGVVMAREGVHAATASELLRSEALRHGGTIRDAARDVLAEQQRTSRVERSRGVRDGRSATSG